MSYQIVCDDVIKWAEGYEGAKFHALLADSPYSLHFMGKNWDRDIAFQPNTWVALAEHLHPGAFGMSFASARGWHRLAVAIEDAGLIIHPSIFMLGYLQGQGFPKATRVKVNGKEPKEWSGHRYGLQAMKPSLEPIIVFQKPYTGKPSECIVATGAGALNIDQSRVTGVWSTWRKKDGTLSREGSTQPAPMDWGKSDTRTTAEQHPSGRWPPNVCLTHVAPDEDGNGGCVRVGTRRVRGSKSGGQKPVLTSKGYKGGGMGQRHNTDHGYLDEEIKRYADPDGLEEVEAWECVKGCPVRELGEQSGESGSKLRHTDGNGTMASWRRLEGRADQPDGTELQLTRTFGDKGTAARFYPNHDWQYEIAERLAGVTPFWYVAKAARRERDSGLEGFPVAKAEHNTTTNYCARCDKRVNSNGSGVKCECGNKRITKHKTTARNPHPTVKPIALTHWLATLLLPPPAYAPRRICIPFGGVMSEAIGATLAGWDEVVVIEMEEEYCAIGDSRLRFWSGWAERGYDDPKAILKAAKKEEKQREKAQMEPSI